LPEPFELGGERRGAASRNELRDRSRLAELLLARGHASAALAELDHIAAGDPHGMADPGMSWLRARALESADRREEGEPLVADPKQVVSSYGPWWAIRGRWA